MELLNVLNEMTLSEFASYFDYMLMTVSITCLTIAWCNVNTRWLLINILAIELLNVAFSDYFRTGESFFIWAVGVDMLFIFLLAFRKYTAYIMALHKRNAFSSLFRKAYFRHMFNNNEAAIIGVYCFAAVLSTITGLEGQLYIYDVISSRPVRTDLYQPIMLMFQFMLTINVIRGTKTALRS